MPQETANQYLKTKVLTASPAELRMLLIEGAIRFAHQAREGLIEKNYEKSFEGFSQSKAILMELINALRPEVDKSLCDKLAALYTFMFRRLIDANLEKDVTIVDEVIRLLNYERETWAMLLEKLADEKKSGAAPAFAAAQIEPGQRQYSSLSVEG